MTFTYNGDPSASDVEQIRFLVGDTVETTFSLTDAEIQFLAERFRSSDGTLRPYAAAAAVAETLSTKFARGAIKSKAVGDLRLEWDYNASAKSYLELADRLRNQSGAGGTTVRLIPYTSSGAPAGPVFQVGMHDDLANDTPDQALSDFD